MLLVWRQRTWLIRSLKMRKLSSRIFKWSSSVSSNTWRIRIHGLASRIRRWGRLRSSWNNSISSVESKSCPGSCKSSKQRGRASTSPNQWMALWKRTAREVVEKKKIRCRRQWCLVWAWAQLWMPRWQQTLPEQAWIIALSSLCRTCWPIMKIASNPSLTY